ncbi:MAG: VanZ family protein [Edaphocola sp.]
MKAFFLFFHNNKKLVRTLAILWTLLILAACLVPGREVPSVSFPLIDKWVHFIIFAVFVFLWLGVFKWASAKTIFLITLSASALGYAVELLQGSGITSGRSYDPWDWLADSIGGILGASIFWGWRKLSVTE